MKKEIVISVDSREQKPWVFPIEETCRSGYKTIVVGSEIVSLNAADYSIQGYEEIVRIERKNGFTELFGNMTPSDNKERFIREMEKLKNVKHKYLIVDGTVNSDILRMSLQQYKYPIPCSSIVKWIFELQLEFNIIPIFAGDSGAKIARMLFEMMVKKYD